MTPQEALSLLDQVCSQISIPREAHAKVQEAIMTLNQLVNPEKEN